MTFDLIVFDWDGTLMDSEARIVACLQQAFTDCGVVPPPPRRLRDVIGLGLREAMRSLWPDADELWYDSLIERYRHHYLVADPTPSPLFPGVREVIGTLAEAGYWLAIATGKSRRGLDEALARTGLAGYFHATRCADETQSKPHPEMLEQILEQLGISPNRALMVGDTEYDLLMARNARVNALAVCYGVHERERLLQHHPLDCLSSVTEIPAWLARGVLA